MMTFVVLSVRLLLLLASRAPCGAAAAAAKTVYIPVPNDDDDEATTVNITSLTGDFPRGAYQVHVVTGTDDVRVVTPPSRDGGLAPVSTQAVDCHVAVNGGPFDVDGRSTGLLVIDGTVVVRSDDDTSSLVGIGRTTRTTMDDANASSSFWILGAPPEKDDLRDDDLDFFVTGFGWLVRDGVNAVPSDDDDGHTGAVRAPRTAVGVTAEGHLRFVVVDGCERCWHKRGLTLRELGQRLIDTVGLRHAVNLDGGSSTTLVENDNNNVSGGGVRLVNHPTCLDYVAWECERPVATVFCLGKASSPSSRPSSYQYRVPYVVP